MKQFIQNVAEQAGYTLGVFGFIYCIHRVRRYTRKKEKKTTYNITNGMQRRSRQL